MQNLSWHFRIQTTKGESDSRGLLSCYYMLKFVYSDAEPCKSVIFNFIEDRPHLGNTKKNEFPLVFRSICTIFAVEF